MKYQTIILNDSLFHCRNLLQYHFFLITDDLVTDIITYQIFSRNSYVKYHLDYLYTIFDSVNGL